MALVTRKAEIIIGAVASDPSDTLTSRGAVNIRPAVPFTGATKMLLDKLSETPNLGQQFTIDRTMKALQALGILPTDSNPGTAAQVLLSCGVDGSLLIDWAGHQDATNNGCDASGGVLVASSAGQWVGTNVTASTNGRLGLDSMAFIVGVEAPAGAYPNSNAIVGRESGPDTLRFLPRTSGNGLTVRINNTTSLPGLTNTGESRGVWGVSRYMADPEDSISSVRVTHGASEIAVVTDSAATSLPDAITLFRVSSAYQTGTINAFVVSGGLDPTLHDAVVQVIRDHNRAMGLYY